MEDGVLVLRRIHVSFTLRAPADQDEAALRAHEHYRTRCPVYRSIHRAIDITSDLRLEPVPMPS